MDQRVLKDLLRIRLSCGPMVRLLAPSPLSREQVVSLSQSSCVSPAELTERVGAGGVLEVEPNHCDREKVWPSINH
jgi:hypothetical protein